MIQIELNKEKDCKHSVQYKAKEASAAITSVYLMRTAFSEMPDKIFVAISEDPITVGDEKKGGKK